MTNSTCRYLLLFALSACSYPDENSAPTPDLHEKPPESPSPKEPPIPLPDGPSRLIAWTQEGDLALVDSSTGVVTATASGAGLRGVRDVAWDSWAGRAVVFESDAEDEWGEIATVSVSRAGL